jgi:serine/threonine protein kinase
VIGEKIREFEIQSELGAGGYGVVYLAHDMSVDRDVAIKVILPQYADNPDFKQRFESEARLVAKLESRQIVPLHQFWQDEQGAFLVMRLIRGGSLRRIMAKQGAMSLSQVVRIFSDIAEALAVAHENDVVHRDLKPENILIDERGNAYLTDFGIAKHTTEAENITEADAIVGTWAYLSPEQVQNVDVTPQSDIYAFGILLYEMLAGKHPFHGVPATMMVMKHLQEPLPDIYDERPDLPQELDDIIQRATAKDPLDRYDSALNLLTDLKAVAKVSGQSVTPIKAVKQKKPTSPEERNRQAMLQNVRNFWIESVLENSVQDAILLNLGKSDASEQISNPWDTIVRTTSREDVKLATDASILDIFHQMNGKLLILGEPGGGKTTMMLELARDLLQQAEIDDAHPLPVVFNLSSWAEKQLPLEDWLQEELSSKYQVPRRVASTWIEDDSLLLLLDGLDEVKADARDACVAAINAYRTEHGFVDLVVCSRIYDYEDLTDKLLLNGAIVIQPLTDEQIDLYLETLGPIGDVPRQLLARDDELHELAHTPLMLNIIAQAYQDATGSDIPHTDSLDESRQHVFERYVDNTLKRRGISDYTPQETKRYLSWIAGVMQMEGTMIYEHYDAKRARIPESKRYLGDIVMYSILFPVFSIGFIGLASFFNSILETSTIWVTVALILSYLFYSVLGKAYNWLIRTGIAELIPAIISGVVIVALSSSADQAISQMIINFSLIVVLIYAVYRSVMLDWAYFNSDNQLETAAKPITYLRFNPKTIRWRRALYGLPVSIPPVLLIGLNLVDTTPIQLILISIVCGVLGLGLMVFFSGLDNQRTSIQLEEASLPLLSARNGLIIGTIKFFVYAIPVFVAVTMLSIPISTALVLTVGIALLPLLLWTFSIGGLIGISVYVISRILHRLGLNPRNLPHFLDYATELILLRKVGNGYLFIHRYLLEYFADLEMGEQED